MKLELHHIAPYLPYELEILDTIEEIKGVLCGINMNTVSYLWGDNEINLSAMIDSVKPLLKPLSDLTKEIEHNGERFFPINKIIEMTNRPVLSFGEEAYKDAVNSFMRDIKSRLTPIKYYEKLLEWKFDVFNLIPNNLAIDINTIKK